jgi:arsenate reductase (thioredoxin)
MKNLKFYKALEAYCSTLESEFGLIPEERQAALKLLGSYLAKKNEAGETAQLTVICTHNSRRSHFGQAWLAVAAAYFGLNVETFSGGTEATAFHPNAVDALRRTGLEIRQLDNGNNPNYEMKLGQDSEPLRLFSKKFDHDFNPQQGFAAIMVCSEADAGCPFVPGADARFSLPYLDPKAADGLPTEAAVYDARCRQMAVEMFYAVKQAI